jgi:hypothetical protein
METASIFTATDAPQLLKAVAFDSAPPKPRRYSYSHRTASAIPMRVARRTGT